MIELKSMHDVPLSEVIGGGAVLLAWTVLLVHLGAGFDNIEVFGALWKDRTVGYLSLVLITVGVVLL